MKISVVIPTYNRRHTLSRTLRALFQQDLAPDEYEIVVVVDGSTDGTTESLKGLGPRCTLRLIEQANRGQAVAQNVGLRSAQGQLVLFLDDDLLFGPSLLRAHAAAHGIDDPIVVFGPVLGSTDSKVSLASDWSDEAAARCMARIAQHPEPRWPRDACVCTNTSVPRSVLLACGGFDENLVRGREDTELGLRLWSKGLRFRYQPSAVVHHIHTKTTRDLLDDAKSWGRNEVLLCRKHPAFRPHSNLAAAGAWSGFKRLLCTAGLRAPFSLDWVLAPLCWSAERLRRFPSSRRYGLRVLELRIALAMLRSAVRTTGGWRSFEREFASHLPVLLYHHVGPRRPGTYPELTVSPAEFRRQVRWTERAGYVGIRPSDWLAWCREGKPLPRKPVLYTFDDAYADLAEYALPVLREYGFGAAVYVVTGEVGGSNVWDQVKGSGPHPLLSAEQIRYWAAQGIEFGAHSRTHPDLTSLPLELAEAEIVGSRTDLEEIIDAPVVSFAYPYGYYDAEVRKLARHVFALCLTCEEGLNSLHQHSQELRRTGIQPNKSILDLCFRLRMGRNPKDDLHRRLARWKEGLLARVCMDVRSAKASRQEPRQYLEPLHQENPRVSVAVCTKDRPQMLERCLASLIPIREQVLEILVIDNNSHGDATRRVAETFNAKYVKEPAPGLCAARNRAIVSASGDILAFTDDDCEADRGWISAIRAGFTDPAVGCVTGAAVPPHDGSRVQRAYQSYSHRFADWPREVTPEQVGPWFYRAVIGVGANMAVRRGLLLEINGFPTGRIPTCGLDDDYMFFKVAERGFKLRYTPASRVYQRPRTTLLQHLQRIYEYGVGEMHVIWYLAAQRQSRKLFLLNGGRALYGSSRVLASALLRGRPNHLLFALAHLIGLASGSFMAWGWRAFVTGRIPAPNSLGELLPQQAEGARE